MNICLLSAGHGCPSGCDRLDILKSDTFFVLFLFLSYIKFKICLLSCLDERSHKVFGGGGRRGDRESRTGTGHLYTHFLKLREFLKEVDF